MKGKGSALMTWVVIALAGCSPATPEKPVVAPTANAAQPAKPTIRDLSPRAVKPGDEVTVRGEGLSTNADFYSVFVTESLRPQDSVSEKTTEMRIKPNQTARSELRFSLPKQQIGGRAYVRVMGDGGLSDYQFVDVVSPILSGIEPANGAPGERLTVQITGLNTHFEPGVTTVWFGGPNAAWVRIESVEVMNSTSLRVKVFIDEPSRLGPVAVQATTGQEIAPAHPYTYFTIRFKDAPVIERVEVLSPSQMASLSGRQGSSPGLRIHGRDFHRDEFGSRVFLGTRLCDVLSGSQTELLTFVPEGETEGDVRVEVIGCTSQPVHVRMPGPASPVVAVDAGGAVQPAAAQAAVVESVPIRSAAWAGWPDLKLVGVMPGVGGRAASALVNGKVLSEGNSIEGVRLVQIKKNAVLLEFNGVTKQLGIGQSTR